MKKNTFIVLVVSAALVGCLGLAGCGSSTDTDTSGDGSTDTTEAADTAETIESDYAVTVDGAEVSKDWEGNEALVVTYSWTNNSEDTTSALVALNLNCYQDGVELETAIMDDIDEDKYSADLKPGASATFQVGYVLESDSDVSIEVSESLSLDDTIIAEKTVSVS